MVSPKRRQCGWYAAVMRVVAVETTSAHGSIALLEDNAVLLEESLDAGSYSTQLISALERATTRAGGPGQIDGFAVANGPGSFTGVRVGLTAIKGLIEVWRKPAAAVSTLAAVAAAVPQASEWPIAVLDASRGEVYYGVYPKGPLAFVLRQPEGPAGDGESYEDLVGVEEFRRRIEQRRGFRLCTPHAQLQGVLGDSHPLTLVNPMLAASVGRLGRVLMEQGKTVDALGLDANYIRRSDAELYSLPRLMRR